MVGPFAQQDQPNRLSAFNGAPACGPRRGQVSIVEVIGRAVAQVRRSHRRDSHKDLSPIRRVSNTAVEATLADVTAVRRDEPDPPGSATTTSPEALVSYRERLSKGEDAIDPDRWAGSLPAAGGVAPRVRIGRSKWLNLLWLVPIGFALLIVAVAAAQGLRHVPAVARFIARYPGTVITASERAHPGLPVWVGVTHFLNLLLMVFIIRAGIQILADHPRLYWTRHCTPGRDWFRFQKPVPEDPLWTAKQDSVTMPKHLGLPGLRHSIGLARWWHLGSDVLWLLNGTAFYALLFATGQWHRVVPTSWAVFPNAASVLIQYLSLQWPHESAWIAYNGLQQLAYFVTIFVAAPLALLTGLGMSPALSTRFKSISKVLSIQVARSVHFFVLCWFLLFILLHTTLVFTTGLLRNLNMGYTARNSGSWLGFGVFAASMVAVVIAWVAATPLTLRRPRLIQRLGFALVGPAQRLFEHVDADPGEYSERDISLRTSGTTVRFRRPRSTGGSSTPDSTTTACGFTAL